MNLSGDEDLMMMFWRLANAKKNRVGLRFLSVEIDKIGNLFKLIIIFTKFLSFIRIFSRLAASFFRMYFNYFYSNS